MAYDKELCARIALETEKMLARFGESLANFIFSVPYRGSNPMDNDDWDQNGWEIEEQEDLWTEEDMDKLYKEIYKAERREEREVECWCFVAPVADCPAKGIKHP